MTTLCIITILVNILAFTGYCRIGLVIPNNFEAHSLVCPEGSPYICAATDGELVINKQFDLANHRFYEGYIGCKNARVAITTSGLATINAALTTQLLIDQYRNTADPIDIILNYGIAGGMDERLTVGDVLVASKWCIYDLWVWQDEDDSVDDLLPLEAFGDYDREFGYWMTKKYGRVWFQPQELFLAPETRTRTMCFNASEEAMEIMRQIEIDVESKLMNCVPDDDTRCLSEAPQLFTSIEEKDVVGLTASIFVDSSSWRSTLFEFYGAQCIEMETGSVAMVAATNEIPFFSFRSLSDLAGGEDDGNEIEIFLSLAVENSITVLTSWIEEAYCKESGDKKKGKSYDTSLSIPITPYKSDDGLMFAVIAIISCTIISCVCMAYCLWRKKGGKGYDMVSKEKEEEEEEEEEDNSEDCKRYL